MPTASNTKRTAANLKNNEQLPLGEFALQVDVIEIVEELIELLLI
jgi:hypothetical protein